MKDLLDKIKTTVSNKHFLIGAGIGLGVGGVAYWDRSRRADNAIKDLNAKHKTLLDSLLAQTEE